MSDRSWIQPIVERVVSQVLESHASLLRTEIVQRVMEEIATQPDTAAGTVSNSKTSDLARAVAEIQVGTSQKEILRGLLDATAPYASRAALFVVKGGQASGWQARGFENSERIKDFGLAANNAAVVRAITERVTAPTPLDQFDPRFLDAFGKAAGNEAQLFPLILKDKVAALVYADGGEDQIFDPGSLEVLVLATSSWLEVNALRKQAQKEPAVTNEGHSATASASPALNDPFAGHAPAFAMAAAASSDAITSPVHATGLPESDATVHSHVAEVAIPVAEMSAAAAAPAPVADPLPVGHASPATPEATASTVSTEDQEVHRKAQRFARLLVDEIKLYNQAKVSEGRKHKDLYGRLKDTIEKSRSTYLKRYGNTVAASGNYFQHELVRSLAEDDVSVMGANFQL